MTLRANPMFALLVAAGLLASAPATVGAQQKITAQQVDQAIARGVESLLASQKPDGGWGTVGQPGDFHYYISGHDVCGLMGLVYGDVSAGDERLQKALKVVLAAELNKNYAYAVRVIALSHLYPRLRPEQQELVKKRLALDVKWLLDAQDPAGDWNYTGTGQGELSNTQMALLAIYEASNVFKELPTEVWTRAVNRYLETQKPDGGWNYGSRSSVHVNMPTYGSMTAAGVASLMIARDKLYGATGCPCKGGRSQRRGNPQVDQAIDRGIDWLKTNFAADKNPGRDSYFLFWTFSCERVGLASGIKYFGRHDWYRELTGQVLARQDRDGGWGQPSETALAIAFLAKGRAPILFNKLQFKGDWNNHPRDMANLARYVSKVKEQPIQWQVINLEAPVEEMHDAPILYISAEEKLDLPDEQKRKLREFTDSGGTILFEASCGNREAALWWELTCKELWPEWELKLIDRDHPLWSADQQLRGRLPVLQGISDGLRTFLFYSKADLSCPWNTEAVAANRVLFDFGGNLYMYSTDRGKLRARLARSDLGTEKRYADQKPARGPKGGVSVARIRHGGDWYLGANYRPWQALAADARARMGLELKELDPVAPGEAVPEGVGLLYLSGRTGCDLGAGGAKWLKDYLGGGGFLLAEAVLGDQRFDAPLRAALGAAGLAVRPLEAESPIMTGRFEGEARGFDAGRANWSFALQAERVGQPQPALFGIYDVDKLVGVYSPFDIVFSQTGYKAFGNRGYAADDARALATNIAVFLSTR